MSQLNISDFRYRNNNDASGANVYGYNELIAKVRDYLTGDHANELTELLGDSEKDAENTIKRLISEYVLRNKIVCRDIAERKILLDKLFDDMAGIGHIKEFINDGQIEEINCNSWDDVEVVTGDGYRKVAPFSSPQACYDITLKMCRLGGLVINETKPKGDSYITEGIRISAMIPPVIDDARGAAFSIRKQGRRNFTRDEYIANGVATKEELDFLTLCINNGVSIAFCGGTGSGKTTDMGLILSTVPENYRIFVIEDTRELNLLKRVDGETKNRVIHTKTNEYEKNPIEMDELLKISMRFHPDLIVPAEMRDKVALTAVEAGRTGHTIVTSLHANSARDGYKRVLTMCMQSGTALSEEMILDNIIEAFPIVVFKRQLKDMSRKMMEIFEAEKVEGKKVIGRTLFEYVIESNYIENGKITKIIGKHKKVKSISSSLAHRLLNGGAGIEDIKIYAEEEWEPLKKEN